MRLELPFPPSGNSLKAVVRGRMVKTAAARQYHAATALLAKSQMTRAGEKRIESGEVSVQCFFRRPAKRGDLDNSLKVLLDALTGIAYRDDSQISKLVAERTTEPERPGVIVYIEARLEQEGRL